MAHIYSHLTKPLLDLLLVGISMFRLTKKRNKDKTYAPLISFVVGVTTAEVLRLISPKFGKLVAQESHCKGQWRHLHSR